MAATEDPLFPADAIADWLDDRGVAPGKPMTVERLIGGRSNVMFRIDRGDEHLVLRRPAKVAIEKANNGMRREFRILSALADTPVPHPGAVALCDDQSVMDCTFYVMQAVPGGPPMQLPESLGEPAVARKAVTEAVVDALASLHEVDWRARGLDDFGHPDGFHERQVERWTGQYESYDGRELPEVGVAGTWLSGHLPTDWSPTIMHADYHMMNLLIAPDPPARVSAILDWETATIGDPLLDLGGFCEIWCGALHGEGWPTRAEIIERYAAQRGIDDIPDLRYYEVLYNFRLAILLEGVYQRSLRDDTRPVDEIANDTVQKNLARAIELVTGS